MIYLRAMTSPITLIQNIKSFAKHPNSEHEQALVRMGIGTLICIYIFVSEAKTGITAGTLYGAIFFMCLSALILAHIFFYPAPLPIRKAIGIFNDTSAVTYSLFFAAELGLPIYLVYMWITFGNGFRFGKKYLYFSLGLSLAGFASVLLVVDYWRSLHEVLGVGLWFGLILVGLYFSSLVARMSNALLQEEKANQAKRRFISSVSHELRTPLNAIIGMANLLRSTELNAEQADMVHSMDNASHLMLSLIEDVLDFSKIEAGKLVVENVEFDLHQLTNNIVDIFKYQANSRGLHLLAKIQPDVPFALRGDPYHLRQVLVNLLANAVKFTEKGSIVLRIETISDFEHSAQLRFSVEDTGIGISEEAKAKVFESFTQADDSTTRRYGGTGLGTTISKQLVELMGGKLGLYSTVGVGSTFWFELCLQKQDGVCELHRLTGVKTLLVGFDDEEACAISVMLDSWGVPNQQVNNLNLAFAELEKAAANGCPFQLTLLDGWRVRVAKQEGDSTTTFFQRTVCELQKAGKNADLGVILCGASILTDKDGRQLVEEAGLAALLDVPVEKKLLFNALHAVHVSLSESQPSEVTMIDQHIKPVKSDSVRYSILVAEDNPTNQKVISKILERAQHRYTLVNNGEEALDKLEQQEFDIIILDMNMPEMTGIEAAKAYRIMRPNKDERSPVIMLSADVTRETKEEALVAGINEFLPKPIQVDQFLETLDRLVNESRTGTRRHIAQPIQPIASSAQILVQPEDTDIVLNYATLTELESIGQDKNFVDGLIVDFIGDNKKLLKELEESLALQHYEEFKDHLHAMKGAALSIGALSLRSTCQHFEKMPHTDLKCDAKQVLSKIQNVAEQLYEALEAYRKQRQRSVKRQT